MYEADTLIYANEGKNVYMFDKWLDGALLTFYLKELEYSKPTEVDCSSYDRFTLVV